MADAGGWESFHSINCESQSVLAEMNETLGSLRQWQKQRDLTLKSPDLEGGPAAGQSLSGRYPVDSVETTAASTSVDAVDDTDDPLLVLWQVRAEGWPSSFPVEVQSGHCLLHSYKVQTFQRKFWQLHIYALSVLLLSSVAERGGLKL